MPPESPRYSSDEGRNQKETKFLLLLSRVAPGSTVLDEARTFMSDAFDWDKLLACSLQHGTSGIIYTNLLKLQDVPVHVLNEFKKAYNSILRSNVQLVTELDRILQALEVRGIEVIPLKGPTASEIIFGDIGLYPGGDIDILVHIEDIDGTRKYLESEGYKLLDKGFDEYRDYFVHELYHLRFSNGAYVLEPHWNLFYRYFTAPSEFWWSDTVRVFTGEKTYRFLSPGKNILYNSFRVFSKAFIELRFLVMVAEMVRHYENEMDWRALFSYARKFGFESVLRVILRLSWELLGAEVPGEYREIKKYRVRILYRTAYRMALKGGDVHPFKKALLLFLKDDLIDVLRILLRRIFPSMGEIISRYQLPAGSPKAVAYYLMNPIILSLRWHQNKSRLQ